MELVEFLEQFRREHGRCGAQLLGVDFRWSDLSVFFRGHVRSSITLRGGVDGSGGKSAIELQVRGEGVEDWAFAPEHRLLEGCCEIELVTNDPRLTRAHLEFFDYEGFRTDYPEKVVMMRFGSVWVVAERLVAEWVEEERRNGRGQSAKPQG